MFSKLNRRQIVILWVVGIWISAASFWGFLSIRWGITRLLLAAIPALILGVLAAGSLKGGEQTMSIQSYQRWQLWLGALVVAAVFFLGGVLFSYELMRRADAVKPTSSMATSTGTMSRRSLKDVFEQWRNLSSQPEFSKLTPAEQLSRKKKFFREVVTQEVSGYAVGSQPVRELTATVFFWNEISEAAIAKAQSAGGRSLALVTQDDWSIWEQRLESAFARKGMSFDVKLHASSELAQVYDQLSVHHPRLVIIVGSSGMRDEVLKDIASSDRLFGTRLSNSIYVAEPPSPF